MNQEQRNQVAELWSLIAAMYGKDLARPVLKIMIDGVSDLPFASVMEVLTNWTKTSKQQRHPMPVEIREAINPPVDDRMVAIDLARKIDRACINHGHYWAQGMFGSDGQYWEDDKNKRHPSFKEAVISELGAVGWHAICSRGGWEQLSSSANAMEEGTFIAQMRDHVQASLALSRAGVDVARIEMPSRHAIDNKPKGLQQIGSPFAALDRLKEAK